MTVIHQKGAPYPANIEHLGNILSIGQGHELPEGAEVLSVSPAVNFAENYPGGWGYIIAFTAEDQAIRDYVTNNTNSPGELIESYPQATQEMDGLEDVELSTISNPWKRSFDEVILVLERPLGRGWLIIRGAPR